MDVIILCGMGKVINGYLTGSSLKVEKFGSYVIDWIEKLYFSVVNQ
jgi:hypothetical protein